MSNYPPNFMQSMAGMGSMQPQLQPPMQGSFCCNPGMMQSNHYQCMPMSAPMWSPMQSSNVHNMPPQFFNQNQSQCMQPQQTAAPSYPHPEVFPNITIPPITPYMIVNGQPQPMVGPPPQLLWTDPIN